MRSQLADSVCSSAARLVELCGHRGTGAALDYSQASLAVVEEMADEAARCAATLSPDQVTGLVQDMGCYILEVGRREFDGNTAGTTSAISPSWSWASRPSTWP